MEVEGRGTEASRSSVELRVLTIKPTTVLEV